MNTTLKSCSIVSLLFVTTAPDLSWAYDMVSGSDGWERYADAIELDGASAVGAEPGQETAEGAVLSFYASLLRGDEAHLAVVPPEGQRHPGYGDILEALAAVSYQRVRLLARKAVDGATVRIRLQLEGVADGEAFSGEDEAVVQLIGGLWYLTQPPI